VPRLLQRAFFLLTDSVQTGTNGMARDNKSDPHYDIGHNYIVILLQGLQFTIVKILLLSFVSG
jgi:hypothetical protein